MNYAVVDLGSNTVRLSVYKALENGSFKLLLTQKETAGLVGYISDGSMSKEGICKICSILSGFKEILGLFGINEMNVFATAPLRNISNTDEAVEAVNRKASVRVDVLSGKEEAELGYYGAVTKVDFSNGVFFDIGGGSTETLSVMGGILHKAGSFPIGSLNLFEKFTSGLWPTDQELSSMTGYLESAMEKEDIPLYSSKRMCGIGGTARAFLKIANAYLQKPPKNRVLTIEDFACVRDMLYKRDQTAKKLILQKCPDRVHTIIPGTVIMSALVSRLCQNEILISSNGVREGYLCKKLMSRNTI